MAAVARLRARAGTSITAIGAALLVCGGFLSGCSGKPASFQSLCDHVAAVQTALDAGDLRTASAEVTQARDWTEPAYEDTEGSRHFLSVSRALDRANRETIDSAAGRRALSVAVAGCA
jgi:hypothetical protein